ncbi:hypothetical protein QF041_004300 [Paenibacillus sp. W2I17]|nr:hypothetical protein [Paenibacillus xylanexedens]MDQ0659533.1 hypothetical protein [Paenibacillus sp. W2I17]MDR6719269.1 hypothetical protein [Paenibacillus sp. 2003]PJN64450.1 hypothetical protein PAEAM_07540 [Paenibacillus sp. GM1FR]
MKRKLALLIATCSIVVFIVAPATEPVPGKEIPNPEIMRPADHGFGT